MQISSGDVVFAQVAHQSGVFDGGDAVADAGHA